MTKTEIEVLREQYLGNVNHLTAKYEDCQSKFKAYRRKKDSELELLQGRKDEYIKITENKLLFLQTLWSLAREHLDDSVAKKCFEQALATNTAVYEDGFVSFSDLLEDLDSPPGVNELELLLSSPLINVT